MFRYLALLIIALLLLFGVNTSVHAGDCGIEPIKPIPPIGCKDLRGVCVCDSDGHCHWEWQCVPD